MTQPQQKKIVVIEDDKSIALYLTTVLTHLNYQVVAFEDGKEALEKIEVVLPDLILSDVLLPGLDGLSIAKHVASNPKTRHIPIILVTCLTDSAAIRDSKLSGVADIIAKPFDRETLKASIEKALR
jgi:CheY-like chemotaxis protein